MACVYVTIAALPGRAAGCLSFSHYRCVYSDDVQQILIYLEEYKLSYSLCIRWKKSFHQIHSPPEEELQPEPGVPGVVVAGEDPGGAAGERWDCY